MGKPKALLIAERKSVANDINRVYARIRDSYPYAIDVAYCAGHLIGLCTPDEYEDRNWKAWDKDALPLIPDTWQKKVLPSKASFFDTLKRLYENGSYDLVINAGDAGHEGQLIQTWVYEAIGVTCPIYRYWADDTTDRAIEKALNSLVPNSDYQGLTDAAVLRAYLDWLCDMNYSRAASIALDRKADVGRVMTPTLAMIVNREKEIKNFSPEVFYELEAVFISHKGEYKGILLNPEPAERYPYRFHDRESLEKIGKPASGEIVQMEQEERLHYAPTLYNLADLQKECAAELKLSPKKTLDIAQSLYEKHYLSYPKTDSKCLSSAQGNDILKILLAVSSIADVSNIASTISKGDISRVMGLKTYVDDAKVSHHPALIPTREKPDMSSLSKQESTIYMMVVKRFLAIFLPPEKRMVTTFLTASGQDIFKSTGNVILDKGYTVLYGKDKEGEQTLPDVKEGEFVTVKEAAILEKKTMTPRRYTLSTILTAMETAGKTLDNEELEKVLKDCASLGTPATRANILEKLLSDEYISNQQGSLVPTEAGAELIDALAGQQIVSAELAANWEKILKYVERGQYPAAVIYAKMIESVSQNTARLLSLESLGKVERKVICQCPKCGKNVYESKKRYFCEGVLLDESPCDFNLAKSVGGIAIRADIFKIMCEGGQSEVYHFTWKENKISSGRLCITDGEYDFVKNIIGKCPKCGRNVISGGNSFYCEGGTKENSMTCDFFMYNKIGITAVPDMTAQEVLENGISSKALSVKFKSGKKNRGLVTINPDKPQFFALKMDKLLPEEVCACPYCNNGVIMHDGKFYVCSNHIEGLAEACDFKIWDSVFETPVSPEHLKKLLRKTPVSLPFLSKDKKYPYKKEITISYNKSKGRYEYQTKRKDV